MKLLRNLPQRDYPDDYLFARIRGRQAKLIKEWQSLLEGSQPQKKSDEEIWENFLIEFQWLYQQMNSRLRKIMAPVFLFFELRTMTLCLRSMAVSDMAEIEEICHLSLLAKEIQQIFLEEKKLPLAVKKITVHFSAISQTFKKLEDGFATSGIRGFEECLYGFYLNHVGNAKLHPMVKFFFKDLIDYRNIMISAKHMRWEISSPAPFINGGHMDSHRFRKSLAKGSFEKLPSPIKNYTNVPIGKKELWGLEISLLSNITRQQYKRSRNPDIIGQIINYLWRRHIETMNQGIILYGTNLERESLTTELIQ